MGPAGKKTRLRRGRPAAPMHEPRGIDFLFTEILRQHVTRGIVAQNGYRVNPPVKIRQPGARINAYLEQRLYFLPTQYEHGPSSGEPGFFSNDDFIGNDIT